MMDISRANWRTIEEAHDIAIVIDVIRAFSVAGYGFAGGARRFWLVREVADALTLRTREPGALLIGEVGGRLIPGFDLNNSPARIASTDVRNRVIIQRTGAGTRGAVAASSTSHVLLAAFTNARATAAYARQLAEATNASIAVFPTATHPDADPTLQNEDDLCANYLEALLRDQADAPAILARGLAQLRAEATQFYASRANNDPDFPPEDATAFLDADRFDFAMHGTRKTWQEINYVEVERINIGQ